MRKLNIAEEHSLKPIKLRSRSVGGEVNVSKIEDAKKSSRAKPKALALHYIYFRQNAGWTIEQIAKASNFQLPEGETKWNRKILVDCCVNWLADG